MSSNKNSLLQMMELVDECMEQLENIKLDVQIKIDANKPSAPAPLPPPPPPSLIQPGKLSVKFKSIDGLTISSGRTFLEHVSLKNRPKTSFDIEVSAAVKRRRAEIDKFGRPASYWDSLHAPSAKRRKTELEIKLEQDYRRRNNIQEMDQDE